MTGSSLRATPRERPQLLRSSEIDVSRSSYVDPQGYLFRHQGHIYRYIRPEAAELFARLLDDGSLDRLRRERGLIQATSTALEIDTEAGGLIIAHPEIKPLSYCSEWCPGMLWEAARLTLDLAIDLAAHDLVLQDAYPWNVLFDGSEAAFVDLTSIARPLPGALWPAHEQYESFFWRPLVLINEGKGRAVRAMLSNNIQGIDLETFAAMASAKTLVRHPGILVARALERKLQTSTSLRTTAKEFAKKTSAQSSPQIRMRFLKRLRDRLASLRRRPKGDCWTNYYSEIAPGVDKQAKLIKVGSLLDTSAPGTVLDLGCNTGVFSVEAARCGARVYSIDSSESCTDLLFETARAEGLKITPFVADIACPTAGGGFMGVQYPPLFERVRAETVLCLALMHHLHISARQPFSRIAELLDKVCARTLIFEFVARDDANVELLPTGRKIDYTLESVIDALSVYFPRIEMHDSDRPTRKLLLCAK